VTEFCKFGGAAFTAAAIFSADFQQRLRLFGGG